MVRTLPTTTKALLPIMAVSSLLTISQEGDPPTLRELFQRLTVPAAIALTEGEETDQSSRSALHRRAPSRARIDASAVLHQDQRRHVRRGGSKRRKPVTYPRAGDRVADRGRARL